MADVGDAALRSRQLGGLKTGTVTLRDFDRGVIETLRSVVINGSENSNYYLLNTGVPAAPGQPGIPVTFAYPEDIYEKRRLPGVVVSRDDIAPAMQRYHPGAMQYNAPASNSRSVTYNGRTFVSSTETLSQAVPMDVQYTINLIATSRAHANKLLEYTMRIFPPYTAIYVVDSIGDQRTYSAWMDGVSMLDELADVSDRTIGFAMALRVEAEFDLSDPEIHSTVIGPPTLNMQRK